MSIANPTRYRQPLYSVRILVCYIHCPMSPQGLFYTHIVLGGSPGHPRWEDRKTPVRSTGWSKGASGVHIIPYTVIKIYQVYMYRTPWDDVLTRLSPKQVGGTQKKYEVIFGKVSSRACHKMHRSAFSLQSPRCRGSQLKT